MADKSTLKGAWSGSRDPFLPRYAMLARYLLSSCICLSVRLFVCLSVYLSEVGVLQRRLNLGSNKQRCTIARDSSFLNAKNLGEIRTGSPPTWAPNRGWAGENVNFRPIFRYICNILFS